jgi:hypothetical protein
MRTESQRAIAVHLRSAIWNWIDVFPSEFNEAIRVKGKTEGTPERVFDLLYSAVHAGSEKIFWPTLTILNCISPDRVSADVQYGDSTHTHKSRKVFVPKLLFFIAMKLCTRNSGSLKIL